MCQKQSDSRDPRVHYGGMFTSAVEMAVTASFVGSERKGGLVKQGCKSQLYMIFAGFARDLCVYEFHAFKFYSSAALRMATV